MPFIAFEHEKIKTLGFGIKSNSSNLLLPIVFLAVFEQAVNKMLYFNLNLSDIQNTVSFKFEMF